MCQGPGGQLNCLECGRPVDVEQRPIAGLQIAVARRESCVRVCIATAYTENFREIGDLAAMTHRFYADRHGLDAKAQVGFTLDRPASWFRVRWIPQLFDEGYDYVLWVDADAIFSRFDVDIRSLIDPNADMHMVQHHIKLRRREFMSPNMGVILLRNCQWSRDLLAQLWSMTEYTNHHLWENGAFLKLAGYNNNLKLGPDRLNEELLSRVKFLSDDWNRTWPGGDPIIRHYAGISREARLRTMPAGALRAYFTYRGIDLSEVPDALIADRAYPVDRPVSFAKRCEESVRNGRRLVRSLVSGGPGRKSTQAPQG